MENTGAVETTWWYFIHTFIGWHSLHVYTHTQHTIKPLCQWQLFAPPVPRRDGHTHFDLHIAPHTNPVVTWAIADSALHVKLLQCNQINSPGPIWCARVCVCV